MVQFLEESINHQYETFCQRTARKRFIDDGKVGLRAEFYDRYPHMFSGGQRQRIAIARGLMLDPDVFSFSCSLFTSHFVVAVRAPVLVIS